MQILKKNKTKQNKKTKKQKKRKENVNVTHARFKMFRENFYEK